MCFTATSLTAASGDSCDFSATPLDFGFVNLTDTESKWGPGFGKRKRNPWFCLKSLVYLIRLWPFGDFFPGFLSRSKSSTTQGLTF